METNASRVCRERQSRVKRDILDIVPLAGFFFSYSVHGKLKQRICPLRYDRRKAVGSGATDESGHANRDIIGRDGIGNGKHGNFRQNAELDALLVTRGEAGSTNERYDRDSK